MRTREAGGRPALLYLCHRIPYPPNKGDKIRSYHLLRYLAQNYRVYLGTFIDDPNDKAFISTVSEFCEESIFVTLRPLFARVRSAYGFLNGAALSIPYYASRELRKWVQGVAQRVDLKGVLAFSSPMAQYTHIPELAKARKVIDFVDVDSEKWAQYAANKRGLEAWIYRRESKRLADFEHDVARQFNCSVLVSEVEAALFRARLGDATANVVSIPNGVDSTYFAPLPESASPFAPNEAPIVFTGAMDYWANVDAVTWFSHDVMPFVLQRTPNARFYIVGSNPSGAVLRLAGPHTVVTGRVPDVRPYLQHAAAVVAPMRIARGIQNKVLEGMAMGKAVVTTSKGLEGISATPGEEVLIADTTNEFAAEVTRLLTVQTDTLGAAARSRVVHSYDWNAALSRFAVQLAP